jgi:hypothetical protein
LDRPGGGFFKTTGKEVVTVTPYAASAGNWDCDAAMVFMDAHNRDMRDNSKDRGDVEVSEYPRRGNRFEEFWFGRLSV